MKFGEYIGGRGTFLLRGADTESCLNRLSREGIPLGNVLRQDEFSLTFTAPLNREGEILSIGERAYCQCSCRERRGLREDGKRLLRRPLLVLSLLTALCLTFLMDSLIWKMEVDAGDPEVGERILHVLSDLGVDIWARSGAVDPQELRYALLNEIPELSWVAVNPKGGRLTVLALLKPREEKKEGAAPANLIALRDGVITESVVLEGMALVKPGDSVKQGQILVSGVEDYGLYLKAVEAEGEIFGQTWHKGTLITPSQKGEKHYTGRTFQEVNIIFGRKSINLSGSSSNLGVSCDKIIDTKQLSLPGCSFPLYLQRITYREYTLADRPLTGEEARELLCRSWENSLLSSMIAGRIEDTDSLCFGKEGLYIFQGESICHELLSRPMPLEPSEKGVDPLGTDH